MDDIRDCLFARLLLRKAEVIAVTGAQFIMIGETPVIRVYLFGNEVELCAGSPEGEIQDFISILHARAKAEGMTLNFI